MDDSESMPKKRTASVGSTPSLNAKKSKTNYLEDLLALHEAIGYRSMSLVEVHDRILSLCRKVPEIPQNGFELWPPSATGKSDRSVQDESLSTELQKLPQSSEDGETKEGPASTTEVGTPIVDWNEEIPSFLPRPTELCRYDRKALREWATGLQAVLEEFYLLVALVSPATYRWGADRSGAAEQNLSLLSNEFVRSQEQITARVTTRLNDVLAPVVTLVTEKTITTRDKITEEEVKRNFFVTTYEDPDYVNLAYTILARNSSLIRQIVLANFDKLLRAITDYLKAQKKDSQHDARGLVY